MTHSVDAIARGPCGMLAGLGMAKFEDPYQLVDSVVAGKYRVEAAIDRGGYGLVYRAHHEMLGVPVALKFFTGLTDTPAHQHAGLLERFAQEGALMTRLSTRSANIVQARDIGTLVTDGGVTLPYLVLEWLEGKSLEHMLHGRNAPAKGRYYDWHTAFTLLDGVARALSIAHNAGVAHRDIKPGNFFVLGDDLQPGVTIKLLDFGIAKLMPQDVQVTKGIAGEFTPTYGAPEQFDRRHGATGPWSDVFGFALVLLELVRGGARVFPQKDFTSLALAVQDPDARPTPRTLGLDASDAVEAVFAQALALTVADRFVNMAAFWNALASALELREFQPVDAEPLELRIATTGRSADNLAASSASQRAVMASVVTGSPATGGGTPDEIFTVSAPPGPAKASLAVWLWTVGSVAVAVAVTVGFWTMFGTSHGDGVGRAPAAPKEVPTPAVTPEPASPPPPERCPEGMALVPGGKFFMGSDAADNPALASARPAHKVEVEDFCIDIHEVRMADYAACSTRGDCKRAFRESMWPQGSTAKKAWVATRAAYSELCNEGQPGRDDHPVNCVTWAQADAYCQHQGKRLPREAEWEFAARGSDGRVYPWGDDPPGPKVLNGCGAECNAWRIEHGLSDTPLLYPDDDGFPGTAPVGSFPAGRTQAGLMDMVGNVFEWTADDFAAYPDAPNPGKATPGMKVMRGGAFNSTQAQHAEPALRFGQDQTAHVHAVGFRCARAPD